MRRSVSALGLVAVLLAGPARAAPPRSAPDAKRLEHCRALVALEDEARKNADGLEASCADLKRRNAALEEDNARLAALTSSIGKDRTVDLKLALESKRDLAKTVEDLETTLEACEDEVAAPWYGRWELWVGAAAGLAAGLGVGFAVGRL